MTTTTTTSTPCFTEDDAVEHDEFVSLPKDACDNSYYSSDENDDSSSYYSSEEEYSLGDELLNNGGGDSNPMTVNEIANLLGTMKFVSAEQDLPSRTQSSGCLHEAGCSTTRREPIDRSASLPPQAEVNEEPDKKSDKNQNAPNIMHFLDYILKRNGYKDCSLVAYDKVPAGFFHEITEENIKADTTQILTAVRSNNIDELKRIHSEGHCMQCCNKFGESILHLACRRGYTDIVRFLLETASVSVNIRDDYGRTPFHDACWVSSTDFDLIDLLLKKSPDLLFVQDKRGFSPLQYVKSGSSSEWNDFLTERKDVIVPTTLFVDRE